MLTEKKSSKSFRRTLTRYLHLNCGFSTEIQIISTFFDSLAGFFRTLVHKRQERWWFICVCHMKFVYVFSGSRLARVHHCFLFSRPFVLGLVMVMVPVLVMVLVASLKSIIAFFLFWSIFHVSIDPQNQRFERRLTLLIVSKFKLVLYSTAHRTTLGLFSFKRELIRVCLITFFWRFCSTSVFFIHFIFTCLLIESTIRFKNGQ